MRAAPRLLFVISLAVKDMHSWVENVKWRMDPSSPERYADLEARMTSARMAASEGRMIVQNLVGGYMYLRSLIGPENLSSCLDGARIMCYTVFVQY